jgi:hypothetical protein
VLLRVQTHRAARIDELLPHNWTRQDPSRRPEQVDGALDQPKENPEPSREAAEGLSCQLAQRFQCPHLN